MGRSLGSLCVLELAYHYGEHIRGLVIESGFAGVTRLIRCLNLPARGLPLGRRDEEILSMISQISVPALIIHGEMDTLIPPVEARHLCAALTATRKKIVMIARANHNNIISAGREQYFAELRLFVRDTDRPARG